MNEICPNCGKPTSEHLMIFYPDGRVEETCRKYVSVPVEFVEAVKKFLNVEDVFDDDPLSVGINTEYHKAKNKMRHMLTEIEKGGGV